jgi:Flp pilus assembly protein TadG
MRGTYRKTVVSYGRMPLRLHCIPPRPQRQRGAFAVMTALLILVIIGFCGLAIDLGRVLNRKAELQTAADTIALFAARELDGTDVGINNATRVAARMAIDIFYNYNGSELEWSNDAIRFGSSPYGSTWLEATSAARPANVANLFYVRVDTSQLAARFSDVGMSLLQVLPSIGTTTKVSSTATAGRSAINVMPLAICAMSETPGQARGTELVEYGFRRGITYDLMQLNPKASTKGANYLVNPIAPAGTTGASVIGRMDVVRPFVCTGTLGIPTLAGGNITVEPDFPLDALYEQLNSRFGTSTTHCNSATAPPDTSTKEFTFSTEFPWMNDTPAKQSAQTATTSTQLFTIADLPQASIPASTTPDKYGPLWIYAKAVKFAGYREGIAEPSGGYTTFNATNPDWATLYSPGPPKIKPGSSYPSPSPYVASFASTSDISNKRRILNIPLLRCPVPSGSPASAEVLAIAKFFMTVRAREKELYAEFAGVLPRTSLVGETELYP